MDVVTNTLDLAEALGGQRCVLVPTMGALHDGHRQLLERARAEADERDLPLAASIFVNPDQFNDPNDLATYPRTIAEDLSMMLETGTEIVLVPSVEAIYPPDEPSAAPQPDLPAVATEPGLEDRFRPGHFGGVCRVVSRLFDLFDPEAAVFGEKDWQQYRVVAAMTAAQGRDTEIIPAPTARERDGLAMSSRNIRLTPAIRERATGIFRGLCAAQGETDPDAAEARLRETMESAGFVIEYAAVRDAENLIRAAGDAHAGGSNWRVLAAGEIESVRLLDNAPWPA